ncbi:MAG: FAD-dependent oxidoreductase [Terracidiphilus sp.]
MPKLRVIIGQGTASEVYQYTGTQGEYETVVIGPKGLWAVLPQTHAMGQPPHLLTLPGQKVPGFQAPTGKNLQGLAKFLDVNTYQSNLQLLSAQTVGQKKEFPNCKVTGIEPTGDGQIWVKVSDPTNPDFPPFKADQVIIASGIGPQKKLQDVGVPIEGVGDPEETLGFAQMEEGIDYLTHPDKLGDEVVVYGGGATGAWVAAEVFEHMKAKKDPEAWGWLAAPGGSGYSKSELPGDRNAQILEQKRFQLRYEIKKAVYRAKDSIRASVPDVEGSPSRPMVELTLKGETGGEFTMLVDQVIFCIGGNPGAWGSVAKLLDFRLVNQLQPLKDQNRMVSDGSGTLAWATPKRDVIIVGAAAFNFQSKTYDKTLQSAPMSLLPPNAQVPDGIAVAVSTIEAMNAYMPVTPVGGPVDLSKQTFHQAAAQKVQWNINFNTSNRTQIAAHLAGTTDTDAFTANLQVAAIVYLRSKNNFGLSESQIQLIMKMIADDIAHLRKTIPNFDERRKSQEKTLGVDKRFEDYLNVYTKNTVWKSFWAKSNISC